MYFRFFHFPSSCRSFLVSIGAGQVQIIGGHHIGNAVLLLTLLPVGTGLCSFLLGDATSGKTALFHSVDIRDGALVGELREAIHVLEQLGLTVSQWVEAEGMVNNQNVMVTVSKQLSQ